MVWFKVDDKLHDHRKARSAGAPAMGLWVLAGSWSADNLEDGFVPAHVCPRWATNFRALAAKLVDAGLWMPTEKHGEPGWQFHQWAERQPMRDVIEKKRAEARERMAAARANRGASSAEVRANTDGTEAEVLEPVPSRPVPVPSESDLGGLRPETLDPATARCTAHEGMATPPNCRGCMAAREAAERQLEQRKRAAAKARDNCPDCHSTGWLEDSEGNPAGKCDHRRSA